MQTPAVPARSRRPVALALCLVAVAFMLAGALTCSAAVFSADTDEQAAATASAVPGPPVTAADMPDAGGSPYVAVNDNVPFFDDGDLTRTDAFELYSALDELGRCGTAWANVCAELMPTGARGDIGSIHPSGWNQAFYDSIAASNGALYNRCHLIGWQLAGEDANELNLITGTRSLNADGMLPFENLVADYVKETGNHVLYRATPLFEGDELVARGVLLEGWSVEDGGEGVCFCAWCPNVQPGVAIDYATGASWESDETDAQIAEGAGAETGGQVAGGARAETAAGAETGADGSAADAQAAGAETTTSYVLNVKSKKFHLPSCSGLPTVNRQDYEGTRDDVLAMGYAPCKICNP
jgi:DNA-entry nuclease